MKAWDDYTAAPRGRPTPSSPARALAERDGDHDPARRVSRSRTDGPYAETKEQLGGFYLIDVEDLDAALEWGRKVPMPGGAVEVRPVMDYDAAGGSDASTATSEVAS